MEAQWVDTLVWFVWSGLDRDTNWVSFGRSAMYLASRLWVTQTSLDSSNTPKVDYEKWENITNLNLYTRTKRSHALILLFNGPWIAVWLVFSMRRLPSTHDSQA